MKFCAGEFGVETLLNQTQEGKSLGAYEISARKSSVPTPSRTSAKTSFQAVFFAERATALIVTVRVQPFNLIQDAAAALTASCAFGTVIDCSCSESERMTTVPPMRSILCRAAVFSAAAALVFFCSCERHKPEELHHGGHGDAKSGEHSHAAGDAHGHEHGSMPINMARPPNRFAARNARAVLSFAHALTSSPQTMAKHQYATTPPNISTMPPGVPVHHRERSGRAVLVLRDALHPDHLHDAVHDELIWASRTG